MSLILGAVALGGALIGAKAKAEAERINKKAQDIVDEAQNSYNREQAALESAKAKTEKALIALGNTKKAVLETTVKQFLYAYEQVQEVRLRESVGLNEVKNFILDKQDALQLREISDLYATTFASGATGAATGTILALAANGTLPLVAGMLSTAGNALLIGEIGAAAGMVGSALSLGATFTPLSAIVAPVVLFTGISSAIKADENLEKAHAMQAEAEAAVEKMKNAIVVCEAIEKRAQMFESLLTELNGMFAYCTALMNGVIKKKKGIFGNKRIDPNDFTEAERKLLAMTGALAGAVKSVIDTPMLTDEGTIAEEADILYEDTTKKLPAIRNSVEEIRNENYRAKPIAVKIQNEQEKTQKALNFFTEKRNLFAVILGWIAAICTYYAVSENTAVACIAFSVVTLLLMDNKPDTKWSRSMKTFSQYCVAGSFSVAFFLTCGNVMQLPDYIESCAVVIVLFAMIFGKSLPGKGMKCGNIRLMIARLSGCMTAYYIALLFYAVLIREAGMTHDAAAITMSVIYFPFAVKTAKVDQK